MPDSPVVIPVFDQTLSDGTPVVTPGEGPGYKTATVWEILGMAALTLALTVVLFYALIKIWPVPTPAMVAVMDRDSSAVGRDTTKKAGTTNTVAPANQKAVTDTGAKGSAPGGPTKTGTGDTGTGGTGTGGTGTGSPGTSQQPRTPSRQLVAWELRCDPDAQRVWAQSHANAADTRDLNVDPKCVKMFRWEFTLWDEQRLLLLVILAGALGAMLHVLRSLAWYVGNRWLVRSWLLRYLVQPFVGATLGLLFYVVVRGGFFSSTTPVSQTSPFGFVAFAALMGLFSEQAILKLKTVTETLLVAAERGAEDATRGAAPGSSTAPAGGSPVGGATSAGGGTTGGTLTGGTVTPGAISARRSSATEIAIVGSGFSPGTVVTVNQVRKAPADVRVVDAQNLVVTVTAEEADPQDIVNIGVTNADGVTHEVQITP